MSKIKNGGLDQYGNEPFELGMWRSQEKFAFVESEFHKNKSVRMRI